jgi:hypothetical protein
MPVDEPPLAMASMIIFPVDAEAAKNFLARHWNIMARHRNNSSRLDPLQQSSLSRSYETLTTLARMSAALNPA